MALVYENIQNLAAEVAAYAAAAECKVRNELIPAVREYIQYSCEDKDTKELLTDCAEGAHESLEEMFDALRAISPDISGKAVLLSRDELKRLKNVAECIGTDATVHDALSEVIKLGIEKFFEGVK